MNVLLWFLTQHANACSKLSIKTLAQLTFTCSKSATETLEKGVKYIQS